MSFNEEPHDPREPDEDEVIVYGVREYFGPVIDVASPWGLDGGEGSAENWLLFIQSLLDFDVFGFEIPVVTQDGTQTFEVKYGAGRTPDKNHDGNRIEDVESFARSIISEEFKQDSPDEPVPAFVVEYDEVDGVVYWDFLIG